MTPERYKQADAEGQITEEELRQGWKFCCEWDFMLIGPNWPENECCTCSKEMK